MFDEAERIDKIVGLAFGGKLIYDGKGVSTQDLTAAHVLAIQPGIQRLKWNARDIYTVDLKIIGFA